MDSIVMVVLSGVDVCIAYPAIAQGLTYLGPVLYHHTDGAWIADILIPSQVNSNQLPQLCSMPATPTALWSFLHTDLQLAPDTPNPECIGCMSSIIKEHWKEVV